MIRKLVPGRSQPPGCATAKLLQRCPLHEDAGSTVISAPPSTPVRVAEGDSKGDASPPYCSEEGPTPRHERKLVAGRRQPPPGMQGRSLKIPHDIQDELRRPGPRHGAVDRDGAGVAQADHSVV